MSTYEKSNSVINYENETWATGFNNSTVIGNKSIGGGLDFADGIEYNMNISIKNISISYTFGISDDQFIENDFVIGVETELEDGITSTTEVYSKSCTGIMTLLAVTVIGSLLVFSGLTIPAIAIYVFA